VVRSTTQLAVVLGAILWSAVAAGQGMLIVVDPHWPARLPRPIYAPIHRPWPDAIYKIAELEVHVRLVDQVAQVQVSQSFVNTSGRPLEVAFVFPLPYDGAIEQMTLLVDGREHPARLLGAEEARRMYEEIVRKNRDPALLEWIGTGMFRTNVFPVPAGEKRTVSLRYSQLCRKADGLTDFLFPLSTAKYTSQPVQRVEFRVTVEAGEEIKNVYSPTHAVEIQRSDDHHATISYRANDCVPSADFRLLYDVGRGKVAARVLSYRPNRGDDGYFLLLASPQIKAATEQPPRKTVVFVMDRSGSMAGKKIDQVRRGLRFMLDRLRPGDLFNIIIYDSEVESFRPELQRFNEQTRKAAESFVEGVYAGGSTDINAALRTAFMQIKDATTPSYIIFLTDGMPTSGVTNEAQIVANAKGANRARARIFAFGVGDDVNARLLDRLVRGSFGQSEYVGTEEDIEDHISRLYRRIESPVMTDVKIEFTLDAQGAEEGRGVNRVYPRGSFDLFAGEQLVTVGRYHTPGAAKVTVSGMVAGKRQSLDFPAELVEKSPDETRGYVEKLWAVRRIGEILDEIDLHGRNEELIKELVDLSTRHAILTPYTSFLADENTRLDDLSANTTRATKNLLALDTVSGYSGVQQRHYKGDLQRANQAQAGYGGYQALDAKAGMPMFAYAQTRKSQLGASAPAYVGGIGPNANPALSPPAPLPQGARGVVLGPLNLSGPAASPVEVSASAGPVAAEADAGRAQGSQETVRNIGNRAFYRRGGQWIDSQLSQTQQAQAKRVKQFSDAYFELARRNGRQLAQYMVFDEPVLLNVEGQAYLIEP
jgi:Ca-activated chloride channel family protein